MPRHFLAAEAGAADVNRNHPVTPDILRTGDSIREALHVAPVCCANHAAEICIIAAASFAADVAKDDPREMRRFFDALSNLRLWADRGWQDQLQARATMTRTLRLTERQVAAHRARTRGRAPEIIEEPKQKKSKFGNIRVESDGENCDSRWEAERLQQLRLMEKAGEIRELRTQVSIPLMVGDEMVGAYVADAVYFDVKRNRKVVEDAKGCRTPLYRWKARHFKAQYGFAISEVRKS